MTVHKVALNFYMHGKYELDTRSLFIPDNFIHTIVTGNQGRRERKGVYLLTYEKFWRDKLWRMGEWRVKAR